MSFPVYGDYKWVGFVNLDYAPTHWRAGRLKNALVRVVAGGTPESGNERFWSDDDTGVPWVSIADMSKSLNISRTERSLTPEGIESKRLEVLPEGSLLYSIYASLGKVGVLATNAVTNQAILGLIPNERVIKSEFLQWWLVSLESVVKSSASSNTQDNLNAEKVKNLPVLFPSTDEQLAISSFLGHETAKIDALIAEQKRLIELLKEKRQAVISHAVTKGINPNAPMKDSGVEWLGEVPAHWVVSKVGYECSIKNNLRTPIDRELRADQVGEYPYYGPTGVLDYIDAYYVQGLHCLLGEDGDHFLKFYDRPMTLLVNGMFSVNNHAHLIKGGSRCLTEWIASYFESRDLAPWLIKQGVGRYKLRKEILQTIFLLIPPIVEQRDIISKLEEVKNGIDAAIDAAQSTSRLLLERRSALISAAVTGKIDVRNWRADPKCSVPVSMAAEESAKYG